MRPRCSLARHAAPHDVYGPAAQGLRATARGRPPGVVKFHFARNCGCRGDHQRRPLPQQPAQGARQPRRHARATRALTASHSPLPQLSPKLLAASALWLALFIPFIHVLHHRDYSAGSILVDRLQSWRTYSEIQPLRSAVELGTTLSVIFWTLRVTGVLTVAVLCGLLVALVVACGNALIEATAKEIARAVSEASEMSPRPLQRELESSPSRRRRRPEQELVGGSSFVIAVYGAGVCSFIYSHVPDIVGASCLTGVAALGLLAAAQACAHLEATRKLGLMLQHRLFEYRANWASRPMRSATEVSLFVGATVGAFAWSDAGPDAAVLDALVAAVRRGTLVGMVGCVASELLLPAPPPAAPPAAATGEASPDFVASPLGSVPSSGSFLKLPPNSAEYGEKLWRRAAVEGALERVAPYASGVAIAFAWFVPK